MRVLAVSVMMVAIALAGCMSDDPLQPEAEQPGPPTNTDPPAPVSPLQLFERYEDRPAGTEREMRLLYGPFTIPPGQDNNRVTVELPAHNGFLVAVAPTLYDVETGRTPSNQEVHIHHAHWFRMSEDPDEEYYTANLAWVFGTGEERTSGSFHDRADADPDGPRYGIFIEQGQPQALIYMLHNKNNFAINLYVSLDVRFVYGTAEEIRSAGTDCAWLVEGEACRAGADYHHLHGKLWGTTFDVPVQPIEENPDGIYIHPIDIPEDHPTRQATDHLGRYYVAPHDGTMIAAAGHLHPNGMSVVIANLGPEGSACEGDLDGDGLPGITLLNSLKIEQVPEAAPHSEEYQMGTTKFGFRAPIREGDRIAQFGIYENTEYASYEAMAFAGMYVDRQQPPAPRDGPCSIDNTGPTVLASDPVGGDPTEGIWNREWTNAPPDHCGEEIGWPACEKELPDPPAGVDGNVVHIADFLYLPGDQSLSGDMGAPVRVVQGDTIRFVNEDVAAGIRHTITSCKWPCNGKYVANYPHPDGVFDSGKLGNLDPIDGGLSPDTGREDPLGFGVWSDTVPYWELDTSELEPGFYTYYCRIHPWMRGWIEVAQAMPGSDSVVPQA